MISLFRQKKGHPAGNLRQQLSDCDLPCFSDAVMNTLTLLRDPDTSVTHISREVEKDPGLHVQVLKTVNSAAFGLAAKVLNINHAISLLGNSRLEAIVLSVAVQDSLPQMSAHGLDTKTFWLVSGRRASLARIIAQHMHPETAVESYAAGLLQDMAVPILANIHKAAYSRVLDSWEKNPESDLSLLEKDAFGYDHADAGAIMAEMWNLPQYLAQAIQQHHTESGKDAIAPAVRLVSGMRYKNTEDLVHIKARCIEEGNLKEQSVEEMLQSVYGETANEQ